MDTDTDRSPPWEWRRRVVRLAAESSKPTATGPGDTSLPHVRVSCGAGYTVVMLVKYSCRIGSSLLDDGGQVRVDKSKFKEPGAPRHGSDAHPEGCEDCLHSSRPALQGPVDGAFPRPRPQGAS